MKRRERLARALCSSFGRCPDELVLVRGNEKTFMGTKTIVEGWVDVPNWTRYIRHIDVILAEMENDESHS